MEAVTTAVERYVKNQLVIRWYSHIYKTEVYKEKRLGGHDGSENFPNAVREMLQILDDCRTCMIEGEDTTPAFHRISMHIDPNPISNPLIGAKKAEDFDANILLNYRKYAMWRNEGRTLEEIFRYLTQASTPMELCTFLFQRELKNLSIKVDVVEASSGCKLVGVTDSTIPDDIYYFKEYLPGSWQHVPFTYSVVKEG